MFSRQPLNFHDGIPVFSRTDEYTLNYEAIADEHLTSIQRDGTNPFMSTEHMQTLEDATRTAIGTRVPVGGKILDVGCGTGRLLNGWVPYDRYGIDISLGYLKLAREQGYTVACSRIEDMPYKDRFFDAAVCTDVLEHVLDLNLCVNQILRVIKPGGYLVVRVPDREDLSQYIGYKYRFVHLRILDGPMLTLMFDRVFGCPDVTVQHIDGEVLAAVRKP